MERPAAETTSDRVCAKQEGFTAETTGQADSGETRRTLKLDDGKCLPGDPAVRVELPLEPGSSRVRHRTYETTDLIGSAIRQLPTPQSPYSK